MSQAPLAGEGANITVTEAGVEPRSGTLFPLAYSIPSSIILTRHRRQHR
jgi:hypothetical protein